jgi:hypothetical protein
MADRKKDRVMAGAFGRILLNREGYRNIIPTTITQPIGASIVFISLSDAWTRYSQSR